MERINREELDEAIEVCERLYKDDLGDPFVLTDGQAEIFLEI